MRDRAPRALDEEALMPRARNIKPGFFQNEVLAELGPEAMLLFAGLWTLADRDGRLEDRPKRIKAQLFPYFEVDVNARLWDLHHAFFITRYEKDGNAYIEVANFAKHQSPHVKEAPSTIPAPDKHHTSTGLSDEKPHETDAPDKHGASTRPAPPDSLIPDSLIADTGFSDSDDAPPARVSALDVRFEQEFWRRWPKGRGSRKLAHDQWTRMKAADREAMLAALPAFLACGKWQEQGGRFVKHAERWLKDRGWEDDVPPDPVVRGSPNGSAKVGADPRPMFDLAEQYRREGR